MSDQWENALSPNASLWAARQRDMSNQTDWNGFLTDNVGFRVGGGAGLMAGRGAVQGAEALLSLFGRNMPGWIGAAMMAAPAIKGAIEGDKWAGDRMRRGSGMRAKATAMEDLIRGQTKNALYRGDPSQGADYSRNALGQFMNMDTEY